MNVFGRFVIRDRKTLVLSGFSVIILGIALGVLFLRSLRADVVSVYPQQCLGTFYNSQNAQGRPEATTTDDIDESNAAFSDGAIRELYCGNFMSADAGQGDIKTVRLKFHWVLSAEPRQKKIIIPAEESGNEAGILQTLLDIVPDKEITIEFASPTPTPDLPEPDSALTGTPDANTEPSAEPVQDGEPPPSSEPVPVVEPAEEPAPVIESPEASPVSLLRLWQKIFRPVFAQEEDILPEPSPTEIIPEPSLSPEPTISDEPVLVTEPVLDPAQETPLLVIVPEDPGETVFINDWDLQTATSTNQEVLLGDQPVDSPADSLPGESPVITLIATPETETALSVSTEPSGPAILEIFYTLDSQTWHSLGVVTESSWQEFEAVLPINDWIDISKIQIRVISWAAVDYPVYAYIDSVNLEVESDSDMAADEVGYVSTLVLGDFENTVLKEIKSDDRRVAVKLQTASGTELWLFDMGLATNSGLRLDLEYGIASSSPLGLKQGSVFWLGDDNALYRFVWKSKRLYRVGITPENTETGIKFNNLAWRIFISGDSFTFNSPDTGEVFSDDNRGLAENFYERFLKQLPETRQDLVDLYFREPPLEEPSE